MSSRPDEEAELLTEMVAIPSVSGSEAAIVERVSLWCASAGLAARADDTGLTVEMTAGTAGPTLAFASHLDVVPAGEGWTCAPFTPHIEGDDLYGRGSGDAKASVTAMLLACRDLLRGEGPRRGRLLLLLTLGEESRHPTMPEAAKRAAPIDAAVIGEPTSLDIAVAQRGLVIAELRAHGPQRHAGHAPGAESGAGAIETLAADILRLDGLFASRSHALLGRTAATPTMLSGGIARNVTAPEAVATLDVRTTPDWTHGEVVAELQSHLRSDVHVLSDRLVPCETPASSALLPIVRRLQPEARIYGSPTCSDWVFLRGADAVKCGPGDSRRSHGPDERVSLRQVAEARRLYAGLAREYLA